MTSPGQVQWPRVGGEETRSIAKGAKMEISYESKARSKPLPYKQEGERCYYDRWSYFDLNAEGEFVGKTITSRGIEEKSRQSVPAKG
jgi:hypothetical protein